jgi:hypothetical protein
MAKRKVKQVEDGAVATAEVKLTDEYIENNKTKTGKKAREPKQAMTTIKCIDCGTEREIKVQDAFQVKRCVECQNAYRKAQRKQYRKNRVLNLRSRIGELEGLLQDNGIEIPE